MAHLRTTTAFDDQMVPEISFDVVTVDGGATVFEAIPSEEAVNKPLPDFDSLLQDLGSSDIPIDNSCLLNNASISSSNTTSFMEASSLDSLKTWDLDAYSELSLYEDSYQKLKPEKLGYIKQEENTDILTDSSPMFPTLLPAQEELSFADNVEIADLKTKIHFVCQVLDIPSDPSCWSSEHVQRWIQWTLKSYNLPEYLWEPFVMSGAALCYLTQDDFRQRSPHAGEFLSAELDIWKTAHNLALNSEFSNQEDTSLEYYPEEAPTFTDLDSVSVLPQVSAPISNMQQQQQPMKCIPTPVITCTSPMTSSSNPCLGESPIMYSSSTSSHSMMSVSPAPSVESLSNASSSGTSWSCGIQSSTDLEDSPQEMPQSTFQDVHTVPCVPHHGKHTIHLWQFLKELLLQPHAYQSCIRWLDRSRGIFKIEDSARVAKLWGGRKNRPAMNYDKLSRSIRQYYKKSIIKKTTNSKRLVYQFCPQYL